MLQPVMISKMSHNSQNLKYCAATSWVITMKNVSVRTSLKIGSKIISLVLNYLKSDQYQSENTISFENIKEERSN